MMHDLQKYLLAAAMAAFMSVFTFPAMAGQALTESESLRIGLARPALNELGRGLVEQAGADALQADLWANPTLE